MNWKNEAARFCIWSVPGYWQQLQILIFMKAINARLPVIIIRFISQQRKQSRKGSRQLRKNWNSSLESLQKKKSRSWISGQASIMVPVILLYRSILHSHRNSTQKIPCFLRWNVQEMKNWPKIRKRKDLAHRQQGQQSLKNWFSLALWKGKRKIWCRRMMEMYWLRFYRTRLNLRRWQQSGKWHWITLPRIQRQQMNS